MNKTTQQMCWNFYQTGQNLICTKSQDSHPCEVSFLCCNPHKMERRGVGDRVPDMSLDLLKQVELSKHGLYSIGLFRSVPISTKWNWSECHVSALSRHRCTAVSHQTSKTKVYYSQYTRKRSNRTANFSKFVFGIHVLSKRVF